MDKKIKVNVYSPQSVDYYGNYDLYGVMKKIECEMSLEQFMEYDEAQMAAENIGARLFFKFELA